MKFLYNSYLGKKDPFISFGPFSWCRRKDLKNMLKLSLKLADVLQKMYKHSEHLYEISGILSALIRNII